MSNKVLIACIILGSSSGMVLAQGAPYLGVGLGTGNRDSVNVFGGFGAKVGFEKNLYLGGELFANASFNHHWEDSQGGASIIPGVFLNNPTMLYARLGVVVFGSSKYYRGSETTGQFGLGMQTAINNCWSLRTEYVVLSGNYNWNYGRQFNLGLLYMFNKN